MRYFSTDLHNLKPRGGILGFTWTTRTFSFTYIYTCSVIVPAVVSSVRFDAATLLAVSDLLSLLSPLQYLLLCRTLSGDHSLMDKKYIYHFILAWNSSFGPKLYMYTLEPLYIMDTIGTEWSVLIKKLSVFSDVVLYIFLCSWNNRQCPDWRGLYPYFRGSW